MVVVAAEVPNLAAEVPNVAAEVRRANDPRMNAHFIAAELRRCPCWIEFRQDETEIRAGILRIYTAINAFDTESMRIGLKLYLADEPLTTDPRIEFRKGATVYALLRVIFEVPAMGATGLHNFGSWGAPSIGANLDVQWPFKIRTDGSLLLDGIHKRYFGVPYDGAAEFEEFVVRFPRRKMGPE